MRVSNPNSKRSLRDQLDGLDCCLKVCLENIYDEDAFRAVANAMSAVVAPIIETLQDNLQGYMVELPLSTDEHKDIDWIKESEKYQDFAEDFKNHVLTDGQFPAVVCALENLSALMVMVKQSLQQLSKSSLFADYCEREYNYFKNNKWGRILTRMLDDLLGDYTSDDWIDTCRQLLDDYLDKVAAIAPKAVEKSQRIIYQEALGHKLWALNHKQKEPMPVDETLQLVAAAEYFGEETSDRITFLDMKISQNAASTDDNMTAEMRRLQKQTQKVKQIENVRFENIVKTTCRTSEYFGPKLSESLIRGLYKGMFADSSLIPALSDKFTEYHRINTICRVVGEFWNAKLYMDSTKAASLAECIKADKPDVASRARYIRDKFPKDDTLGIWIRQYLKDESHFVVQTEQTENTANQE